MPTLSLTVPLIVCEPLVFLVTGDGIDEASTPVPALPSASPGSPLSVNVPVTVFRYQPPPPE